MLPLTPISSPSWRPWLLPAALLLLALLPLAALSYFNHPFMDDYFNAANARQLGFWAGQRDLYLHWTGRFFSSLLVVGANPMHYGWYDGFRLTPLLVLALSYAVAYAGVRTLSPAGRPRLEAAVLAGCVLLTYFHIIPGLYPALYWFTGSVVYQLGGLWVPLALIAGVRASRSADKSRRGAWWAVAALSAVAAAGSNEITLLHVLLGTGLMAVLHRRSRGAWLAVLVLAGVAGVVALAAPGNFTRMHQEYADNPARHSLLEALVAAVPQALGRSIEVIGRARALIWLGMMGAWVLLLLHWRRAAGPPAGPRVPWYLGLGLLLLGLYGAVLVLLLAMGDRGFPDRVVNALWLYWLPASLLAAWAAVAAWPAGRTWPVSERLAVLTLTAAAGLLLLLPVTRRAWRELLLNAPAYDRQLLAREELLRDAGWRQQRHVVVPPIVGIRPERVLITGWDLVPDPNFYVNAETALYFGIKTLRVDAQRLPEAHPDFGGTWTGEPQH